jgi:hypothetical protein
MFKGFWGIILCQLVLVLDRRFLLWEQNPQWCPLLFILDRRIYLFPLRLSLECGLVPSYKNTALLGPILNNGTKTK